MLRLIPRLLLPCLALALVVPDASAADRKKLSVEEQYELGLRYMKRGYYQKALDQFNRIRNYYRDDPYSVKAELAIADVYFKKNEWDQARLAYEDFMRMHPRHRDLDYVVYRMGLSLYKKAPKAAGRDQTWTRQAVNTWSGFEGRFPDSQYLEEATDKLTECRERLAKKELLIARFYERREAWRAVEGRASGLVAAYPDSQYAPEALAMVAVAATWQGDPEQAGLALARLREQAPAMAERAEAEIARVPPEASRGK